MLLALAQINTTVGDVEGNAALIAAAYQRACAAGADLLLAPELVLTGYPPRDLVLRRGLILRNLEALQHLASSTKGQRTGLILGFIGDSPRRPGRELSNAVALLHRGEIVASRAKTLLPTYDVFDEDRYFEPADGNRPVRFQERSLGLTVCEDIWNDEDFWPERRYRSNPALALADAGAQLILNVSASPWHLGKDQTRQAMLASLARKIQRPVAYCNLVGGNDELIFDGNSLVFDAHGHRLAQGAAFAEDFLLVEIADSFACPAIPASPEPAPVASADASNRPGATRSSLAASMPEEEQVYRALVLGLRDYLHKCGFRSAVLGLSGGVDSALTACLAAEALGARNVHGVSLPSQFSSTGSLDDARALAESLGIRYDVIPIRSAFEVLKHELHPVFGERPEDTTEENLQARLRGVLLMALSNKFGSLLLTTGNKSEMAVGYCTLYGDMCGGLAVISDVPKTMVYRVARWINRQRPIIPEPTITKPPSAELRPNQTDQDSLPPYEVLDDILDRYVVRGESPEVIQHGGHDPAVVRKVIRLIDGSEYKRRQAAPGLKVTSKAFGVGRRIPIAHRYREV